MKPQILQAIREANPELKNVLVAYKKPASQIDREPIYHWDEAELRHLLRAIEKNNPPTPYFMSMTGRFYIRHESGDISSPLACFDLTKSLSDNLDDEELCAFLFDLLVKE